MWLVFATAVVAGIFLIVRTRQLMPRTRPIVISCLIALTITYGSFWLAQTLTKKSSINWQHFTDADLKAARDRKELTLVKFTAKWCANCQWIEANVFTSPDVIRAIADKKVTMLKNDRTKSDAPGTELLESLNAGGGIPLTAIYSPKRDEPYTLKSIYTTETFLQALNAAEKGSPFKEGSTDMTVGVALGIALVVGLIFNVMPCVLPVLPLKAIGFYEVSQHNRAKCVAFGVAFSLGIIATFSALALIVLPLT